MLLTARQTSMSRLWKAALVPPTFPRPLLLLCMGHYQKVFNRTLCPFEAAPRQGQLRATQRSPKFSDFASREQKTALLFLSKKKCHLEAGLPVMFIGMDMFCAYGPEAKLIF